MGLALLAPTFYPAGLSSKRPYFMHTWRFESFTLAFVTQKCAEYLLLSFCLAVHLLVGSQSADPAWGIYVDTNLQSAILAAFTGSLTIFLFTLYPAVAFIFVGIAHRLISAKNAPIIPWLSAAVSVIYMAVWVASVTNFDPGILPPSYWIITATMGIFVGVSSAALYPPVPNKR